MMVRRHVMSCQRMQAGINRWTRETETSPQTRKGRKNNRTEYVQLAHHRRSEAPPRGRTRWGGSSSSSSSGDGGPVGGHLDAADLAPHHADKHL
jgi:hypothetical protein